MIKNNIKKLTIFVLCMFFSLVNIYADKTVNLTVSNKDLTVGDEITVDVSAPADEKIYAFVATLKYDEKVFRK